MKERSRIVVVDDDKNFLRVVSYQLRDLGFEVFETGSAEESISLVQEKLPNLVITDLRMPEMNGLELLDRLLAWDPDLPVVVLTAHGTIEKAIEATKAGAFDFLTKPFETEELAQTIANALRLSSLVRENQRLSEAIDSKFKFKGIPGQSRGFRKVIHLASKLADVDTTVLIQGESGTGKELIARAIHFNGRRRNQPFVVVNCGAIPKDLIESELFGYKKGSFTGASTDKKGKVEAANRGTLFLDEIGELPLSMQVKLLRFIQEKEIDVVGETNPRKVDVRILAATNRDLRQMMQEEKFREDLYYRLSVAPLYLPGLRERREDIPTLVLYFLERFQKSHEKKIRLDPEVLETLQVHNWPGNVRELENVVERLVVFAHEGRITKRDLPSGIRRHSVQTLGEVIVHMPNNGFSLEDLERDLLKAALELNDWNQTHAAEYLSISRNTLIYRMQKFGLSREFI